MVLRQKRRKLLRFKRHKLFLILTLATRTIQYIDCSLLLACIFNLQFFLFFFLFVIIEIVCNLCMYNFSRRMHSRRGVSGMCDFPLPLHLSSLLVVRTSGIREYHLQARYLYMHYSPFRAHTVPSYARPELKISKS